MGIDVKIDDELDYLPDLCTYPLGSQVQALINRLKKGEQLAIEELEYVILTLQSLDQERRELSRQLKICKKA